MKKAAFLLALAMTAIGTAAHAVQMPLSVKESSVIKENTVRMLGSNCEWESHFTDFINSDLSVNKTRAEVMSGYPLPSARMAGSSSRVFQWKSAIGPSGSRPLQFNGYTNTRIYYGVLEWINHVKTVNSDAKFTYVLNMETGKAADAADLAEFFCGDGTVNYNGAVNWAEKRKEYGTKKPVAIDIWELGNEINTSTMLGPKGMSKEEYVNAAKSYISAIRAIDPNAVFAACGHTATGQNTAEAQEWNRYVLEQLGSWIDYLTVHLYYTQYDMVQYQNAYMDSLRDMINEISPKVKLYYSEHSTYINNFSDQEVVNRTHGMYGTLATSEFFNRVMIRPEVYAADYHCLYSPNWSEYYVNGAGQLKPTPIADLLKLYEEYSIGNIIDSTLDGYKDGKTAGVTKLAVEKDGALNIIITNQTAETVDIPFSAERNYIMTERSELYADTSIAKPEYADNWYDKTTGKEKHEVYSDKEYYTRKELCRIFSVKPYSVTAVRLEPAEPVTVTICAALYNTDGTLRSVRMIQEHLFITDSGAITAAKLRPGEKAFVWDKDMRPVTGVLTAAMLLGSRDNDFKDEWDF